MENLTPQQQELAKSLIKLGDSEELAIKTALEQCKEDDNSFYYNAYNI